MGEKKKNEKQSTNISQPSHRDAAIHRHGLIMRFLGVGLGGKAWEK